MVNDFYFMLDLNGLRKHPELRVKYDLDLLFNHPEYCKNVICDVKSILFYDDEHTVYIPIELIKDYGKSLSERINHADYKWSRKGKLL